MGPGYKYSWAWDMSKQVWNPGGAGTSGTNIPYVSSAIDVYDITSESDGLKVSQKPGADTGDNMVWFGLPSHNGTDALITAAATSNPNPASAGDVVPLGAASPTNRWMTIVVTFHLGGTTDDPSLLFRFWDYAQFDLWVESGTSTTIYGNNIKPIDYINGVRITNTSTPNEAVIDTTNRVGVTGFFKDDPDEAGQVAMANTEKGIPLSLSLDLLEDHPSNETTSLLTGPINIDEFRWYLTGSNAVAHPFSFTLHGIILGPEPAHVKSLPIEISNPTSPLA